jgi:hypothetical protein
MRTPVQKLFAYVLASLFCLGIYLYHPTEIPSVPVHASTPVEIETGIQRELKQMEIDKAIAASAKLYRAYGCPISLAQPTAVSAIDYHIPVRLNTAVVIVESTCRQRAISDAGAIGYMQIIPQLHHTTRKALFDRDTNLRIGTRYLASLVHQYGLRDGLHHYLGMGVDDGETDGDSYASRVLTIAGYRKE